jgi:hypothetical protein
MKISAIGGLVSVVCLGVLFVLASTFSIHYWREIRQPKIGQRRKRQFRKLMWRWISAAIASAVVGIAGATCYYFAPEIAQTIVQVVPLPKPSVHIKEVELKPLEPGKGKGPVILISLENGPTKTTLVFEHISNQLTHWVPEKYLKYNYFTPVQQFALEPNAPIVARWSFDNLELTKEEIDQLNATPPTAELFFFAKGKFVDESGNEYPLRACWRYDKDFPNHLAVCRDNISFR